MFLHEFAHFLVQSNSTNMEECLYNRTPDKSLRGLETGNEAGDFIQKQIFGERVIMLNERVTKYYYNTNYFNKDTFPMKFKLKNRPTNKHHLSLKCGKSEQELNNKCHTSRLRLDINLLPRYY